MHAALNEVGGFVQVHVSGNVEYRVVHGLYVIPVLEISRRSRWAQGSDMHSKESMKS